MSSEFIYECSTHRGQKRILDPLGLELQALWATWLGSGKQPQSSARVAGTLNLGHPFSPYVILSRKTFLFTLWLDEVALEAMKEQWSDLHLKGANGITPPCTADSSLD